jgi:hypothetical protein
MSLSKCKFILLKNNRNKSIIHFFYSVHDTVWKGRITWLLVVFCLGNTIICSHVCAFKPSSHKLCFLPSFILTHIWLRWAQDFTRNNLHTHTHARARAHVCSHINSLEFSIALFTWHSWIRALWYDYESNQQNAMIQVNLLFLVGSTCFGQCFCPSSRVLDCIYSFW